MLSRFSHLRERKGKLRRRERERPSETLKMLITKKNPTKRPKPSETPWEKRQAPTSNSPWPWRQDSSFVPINASKDAEETKRNHLGDIRRSSKSMARSHFLELHREAKLKVAPFSVNAKAFGPVFLPRLSAPVPSSRGRQVGRRENQISGE